VSELAPGTIVGGRFAIVGALGSGGTATVYLAVDQLRGERIALKVVHPHLARDPGVRRRLQREVGSSALLAHEAALVPWDLHELDGQLCLTLPYHPGQTLAEHVAASGPLPADAVRELGSRVASALAAAHRSGLLHRDVTANNVLVQAGRDAVITDFGLARAQTDATRSTGMLGTAGYAAPEVYAGTRSDPRADLYGLGCVMYLAATGRTPFGTDAPMAVLQRQLAEGFTPVAQLRPDLPGDLAATIESMLRKDPAVRPQSAREVVDALAAAQPAVDARPVAPRAATRMVHLPPGAWAVVVRETDQDRARRRVLRNRQRQDVRTTRVDRQRKTLEAKITERATEIAHGVLAFVGIDPTDGPEPATPEDLLVAAVAREGGVPADALGRPLAIYERRFVLARDVSADSARHLASEVRSLGFQADAHELGPSLAEGGMRAALAYGAMVAGWVAIPLIAEVNLVFPWIVFMTFLTLITPALAGRPRGRRANVDDLPLAYGADLSRALTRPVAGRFPLPDAEAIDAPALPANDAPLPTPSTRGQELLARATGQIEALERTILDLDLPVPAASDLRDTTRELRERATDLAAAIDRLDVELSVEPDDSAWVAPRLHRLQTKQRGGEPVDAAELDRLQALLRAQEQAEAAAARLEGQLTSASAGLLEIAATAARVRRELLGEEPSRSAPAVLERLRAEARAADQARRELGLRAAARERP
jgi:tRNA A-37 threonylcarbamoyl transferase component Bud32